MALPKRNMKGAKAIETLRTMAQQVFYGTERWEEVTNAIDTVDAELEDLWRGRQHHQREQRDSAARLAKALGKEKAGA